MLGSTSCADSFAMSVTTPSAGVMRTFTPNAALTAPNAAAMPASGWRPTLMNATAASGMRTRYPASEATLETIPTKTMMYVSEPGVEIATSRRMSAPTRPEYSATPTPTIATRITPTAANPRKFGTKDVNMNRMPSAVSRPWTLICSVASL